MRKSRAQIVLFAVRWGGGVAPRIQHSIRKGGEPRHFHKKNMCPGWGRHKKSRCPGGRTKWSVGGDTIDGVKKKWQRIWGGCVGSLGLKPKREKRPMGKKKRKKRTGGGKIEFHRIANGGGVRGGWLGEKKGSNLWTIGAKQKGQGL